MRALGATGPRFAALLKHPWLGSSTSRTLSSSFFARLSQSRGGLPRFFSPVLPSFEGGVIRLEGDEVWHMTKVLRLKTDDRVELFDGNGGLLKGCIKSIDVSGVDILALEAPMLNVPQMTQWHVFAACGTLKGGRADWLVEKCTELGASSVTPLLTERSPSMSDNRLDRLERVVLAATKQCQRLHKMNLYPPAKVDELLPIIAKSEVSFIAVAESTPLVSVLASRETKSGGVLIVGPEGDFTEKEVNMVTEGGGTAVSLGQNRLRVETATIALLSTLMLWSDSHYMPDQ